MTDMLTDEQIAQFGYAHSDEHDEPLFAFDRAGFIACVRALLAGQPAAIDKEAVAICTICNGYGRYQDGDSGTEADGYAPNIVECECADEERRPEYRVTATSANVAHVTERDAVLLEAAAIASTHCSRCAALIKARMGSANVAQGAEAADEKLQRMLSREAWALQLMDQAVDLMTSGQVGKWSGVRSFIESSECADAAPPAQTALTDDARNAIRRAALEEAEKVCGDFAIDRWNLYKGRAPYNGSEDGRANSYVEGESDGADKCAAAIRALTAAQSARASEGKDGRA